MTALLLSVLVASLVGSLHCVAMCGALVALYAGRPGCGGQPGGAGPAGHLAYHGGRALSYALAGLLAGAVGGLVDAAGALGGLQRAAAWAAGAGMVAWGLLSLARAAGWQRLGWLRAPAALQRASAGALNALLRLTPRRQALATGLLTPLLPCGWLYLFAVTAAGTGSAGAGAAVMLAFWAGTVPALLGAGLGIAALARRVRRHVPVVHAALLVAVGALTIGQRGQVRLARLEVRDAPAARERVERAEAHRMPCCAGEAPAPARGAP